MNIILHRENFRSTQPGYHYKMNLRERILFSIWHWPSNVLGKMVERSSESVFHNCTKPRPSLFSAQNRFSLLTYTAITICFVRGMIGSLAGTPNYHHLYEAYIEVDHILPLLFEVGMLNRFNAPCIALATLFGLYIDYVVHFAHFNYIARPTYEAMVINPERFFELNPYFKLGRFDIRKPAQALNSLRRLLVLWNLPKNCRLTFATVKLRYYPNAPMAIRARALLVHWIMNSISVAVWCFVGKFYDFFVYLGPFLALENS